MIEKKTLWAVAADLEVSKTTAIVDDGTVIAEKHADFGFFTGMSCFGRRYFETEKKARKYAEDEELKIRDMLPVVKKFIMRMDESSALLRRLGFKKQDYLCGHADSRSSYYEEYAEEQEYSGKLETFIRSRMLNIGGYMLPMADVKRVMWSYHDENGDEYDDRDWLAELTMADGMKVKTGSAEEVRLVKTVFGGNSGIYFVDNDFDYSKELEQED